VEQVDFQEERGLLFEGIDVEVYSENANIIQFNYFLEIPNDKCLRKEFLVPYLLVGNA
jgi:hypothetical protein